MVHVARGELASAEAIWVDVMELARVQGDEGNPYYRAIFQREFGRMLLEQGRLSEAEPLLLECVHTLRERLGAAHEKTLQIQALVDDLYDALRHQD